MLESYQWEGVVDTMQLGCSDQAEGRGYRELAVILKCTKKASLRLEGGRAVQ